MDDIDHVLNDQTESEQEASGQAPRSPRIVSLIHASYLHTRPVTELAGEVVQVISFALAVPVAFAEGFLRSLLSIESVREDGSGRVVIRPRHGASEEDLIREVDELVARIQPDAVFNPVVREQLNFVAEATEEVMGQDLDALAELPAEELHSTLSALDPPVGQTATDRTADEEAEELRRRMEHIRESLREFQHALLQARDAQSSEKPDVPRGAGERKDKNGPQGGREAREERRRAS